jgi:plastocyanin
VRNNNIAAILLLLLTVSCSKEDKGFPNSGGLLPTNYVSITSGGFNPSSLTLAGGNSVTFLNSTSQNHNVVSDDSVTIRSGIIAPQKSYYWKKDVQGTFTYRCTLHPGETGTLVLTP